MLKESTKSSSCYVKAREVFTQKYENATFNVKGPFTTNGENGIDESKMLTIEMKHYETIRNILKTFGDFMRSFSISFNYMKEEMGREIIGDINDNCTKSLIQIEFNSCFGTVLNKLKNSYQNVYFVSLSTDKYQDLKNVSLKLSEIFPQLQQLELKISNVDYWKMVGDSFPHLKIIKIDLPAESARPNVGSLFKNSPNINSLHISYSSLNILRAASKFLPNLKELYLNEFSNDLFNGSQIHFKNVKFLNVFSSFESKLNPQYLVFYQIQYLFMRLGYDLTNEWNTFFTNQRGKTIEYLDISASSFTDEQVSAIVDSQPNIKLMIIPSRTQISVDAIINFAEKSKKLFRFHVVLIDIVERGKLEKQLELNWIIDFWYEDLNSVFITLTR